MTALSLRTITFHISGQYRAEVTDTAVCTPDTVLQLISLCCPVLFQARPIDSLNRTSYCIDLWRSTRRSSIIDLRPSIIDHWSSKVDTSIFDLRPSTIDHRSLHRPSTIDLRIDLRTDSKIEGENIAPTIQHRTDNSSPNIVDNGAPYEERSHLWFTYIFKKYIGVVWVYNISEINTPGLYNIHVASLSLALISRACRQTHHILT